MKKLGFLLVTCSLLLIGLLDSCATRKDLTWNAIKSNIQTKDESDNDIRSLSRLWECQFYISTDVTLSYTANKEDKDVIEKGVANRETTKIRKTINIYSDTPGVLQIKNESGDELRGYLFGGTDNDELELWILFEDNNDNIIKFSAQTSIEDNTIEDNHKFELVHADNKISFDGLTYTIAYEGKDIPYLKYKLKETVKEVKTKRTLPGRLVGSW
jgi:hypothetical protein